MRNAVLKFLATFAIFVTLFVLQKPIFMSAYLGLIHVTGVSDYFDVIFHGLSMDLTMAGYLTVIPGLLILARTKSDSSILIRIERWYFTIVSFLISVVFWLDITLYGYWEFKLDITPLFYFSTSPMSALASAEWWMIPVGVLAVAVTALVIRYLFVKLVCPIKVKVTKGWKVPTLMTLLVLLLFLPIRGSLTVSTMNPSRAYYSSNQKLNHSAVNPMFSLLYSLTHQSSYSELYRYYPDEDARDVISRLNESCFLPQEEGREVVLSDSSLLRVEKPDIYIIVLESFSSSLMPTLGGAPVALGLDSIANEGILFTNFYAGSYRTDRALPAIFSALPPQPSESILKYTDLIERLPSLPRAIKDQGYQTDYYYGGDANFTNMMIYLVSLGIDNVISDKDFPISQKTSKWGVHDHVLFEKVSADFKKDQSSPSTPRLRIIQTSSSHEPFEVPYSNPRFVNEPRLNAFAYTDSCLTDFVNRLKSSSSWNNSLLVILPDHWGVWPRNIEDPLKRHHIPLVIVGGALSDRADGLKIETLGQQTDLAATLLSILGFEGQSRFPFSKNLTRLTGPEFAFFSDPNLMGLVTPQDTSVFDPGTDKTILHRGPESDYSQTQIKSYLQLLYEYISDL